MDFQTSRRAGTRPLGATWRNHNLAFQILDFSAEPLAVRDRKHRCIPEEKCVKILDGAATIVIGGLNTVTTVGSDIVLGRCLIFTGYSSINS